jgi:hypothetical protein
MITRRYVLGSIVVKLEKDVRFSYASMSFTKPMSDEDVSKVEEVLELK